MRKQGTNQRTAALALALAAWGAAAPALACSCIFPPYHVMNPLPAGLRPRNLRLVVTFEGDATGRPLLRGDRGEQLPFREELLISNGNRKWVSLGLPQPLQPQRRYRLDLPVGARPSRVPLGDDGFRLYKAEEDMRIELPFDTDGRVDMTPPEPLELRSGEVLIEGPYTEATLVGGAGEAQRKKVGMCRRPGAWARLSVAPPRDDGPPPELVAFRMALDGPPDLERVPLLGYAPLWKGSVEIGSDVMCDLIQFPLPRLSLPVWIGLQAVDFAGNHGPLRSIRVMPRPNHSGALDGCVLAFLPGQTTLGAGFSPCLDGLARRLHADAALEALVAASCSKDERCSAELPLARPRAEAMQAALLMRGVAQRRIHIQNGRPPDRDALILLVPPGARLPGSPED